MELSVGEVLARIPPALQLPSVFRFAIGREMQHRREADLQA